MQTSVEFEVKTTSALKAGDLAIYKTSSGFRPGVCIVENDGKKRLLLLGEKAKIIDLQNDGVFVAYQKSRWRINVNIDFDNIEYKKDANVKFGTIYVSNDDIIVFANSKFENIVHFSINKGVYEKDRMNSGVFFNKYDILVMTDRAGNASGYTKIYSFNIS